ncbi:MAG: hypothetical protein C4567_17250 [Deltaproteobacteria bacterium]|nr:MAG: hypothetical protein C4567_17250 [Deltaproteobacteria bacterium]
MTADPRDRRRQFTIINPAVVVVRRGETKEQAWRRHVKKHPEDTSAHVRIFHFIFPLTIKNLLIT